MTEYTEPLDHTGRLMNISAIVSMWQVGDLTDKQAMSAIAIETKQSERSAESVSLGKLIDQVAEGTAPVGVLIAWIDEVEG